MGAVAPTRVSDWNVVVSVHEKGFLRARRLLKEFGEVKRTPYRNVLVMNVESTERFLDGFSKLVASAPDVLTAVSRALPVAHSFDFHSREEFEAKAREIAFAWLPMLAGASFHVRLHRRGLKGRIVSPEEERFLDRALLQALEEAGTPGSIDFDDPDMIIDVETVGSRAGLSLWRREDLERYPFLRVS